MKYEIELGKGKHFRRWFGGAKIRVPEDLDDKTATILVGAGDATKLEKPAPRKRTKKDPDKKE